MAAQLQWERLISYGYGKITVESRAGLEATACECYAIVQREFRRLVDGRQSPEPLHQLRYGAFRRDRAQ